MRNEQGEEKFQMADFGMAIRGLMGMRARARATVGDGIISDCALRILRFKSILEKGDWL
jgi:hypothetical protein